jgi:hypothetical protein
MKKLRYDGVYSYRIFVSGINQWQAKLLRFFPDGTLIYALAPCERPVDRIFLDKITRWFTKEFSANELGGLQRSYIIKKNIYFDLSFRGYDRIVTWKYKGEIIEDSKLSLINIGEDQDTYDFYLMQEYRKGNNSIKTIFDFNECDVK